MMSSMYLLRSSKQIFGESSLYRECIREHVKTGSICSFSKFEKVVAEKYGSRSYYNQALVKTLYEQFEQLYGSEIQTGNKLDKTTQKITEITTRLQVINESRVTESKVVTERIYEITLGPSLNARTATSTTKAQVLDTSSTHTNAINHATHNSTVLISPKIKPTTISLVTETLPEIDFHIIDILTTQPVNINSEENTLHKYDNQPKYTLPTKYDKTQIIGISIIVIGILFFLILSVIAFYKHRKLVQMRDQNYQTGIKLHQSAINHILPVKLMITNDERARMYVDSINRIQSNYPISPQIEENPNVFCDSAASHCGSPSFAQTPCKLHVHEVGTYRNPNYDKLVLNEGYFGSPLDLNKIPPTFKMGFPTATSLISSNVMESSMNKDMAYSATKNSMMNTQNPSYDKFETHDTLMPLVQPPIFGRKSWNSASSSVNNHLEKYLSRNRPPSVAYSDSVRSNSNSISEAIHFEV